jgi:hypothetical protein
MNTQIVLGFILGLIGSIVGAFFAHLFSECRRNKEEFNKAATEFRNAFLCEITRLKHNVPLPECERSYTTLREFLWAGYIYRHLKAFEIFRNHLSAKDRAGIDKAWAEYCNFEQYSNKGNEADLKKIALDKIENLLEFAKHK